MKYFKFNELKPGSKITLQLPNEYPINGEVVEIFNIFFIKYTGSNTDFVNDIFFTKCGITDPEQFVRARKIKGPLSGTFPEVASVEELYKVLHYIEDFYDEMISDSSTINRMSKNLLSRINDIDKSTKILYEDYIKYISYLWNELKNPSIIDLYDPSFTHDEEMQKFRSRKINRNNTVYTIRSFGIEQQDCIFIHLKDDKSHFGLKLYRNRENVSMSDIMLLTYVFDMISYLLTEYSCKSVWIKK